MRAKVSLLLHLTRSEVRLAKRLRAVLLRYYPAILGLFSKLNYPIALESIRAYPTPKVAARLSFRGFQAFAKQRHHTRPWKLAGSFARLQTPRPQAAPEVVHIYRQSASRPPDLRLPSRGR